MYVIGATGSLALPALGQFYMPMLLDPSFLKFLPEDAAFTATLEVSGQSPAYRWPVRVAVLKGMTRVEMDASKMDQGGTDKVYGEYESGMRKAGSAESVTIFNPQKRSIFTLLPRLKAYTAQPIPDDALAQLKKRPKAQTVELGTDELDGRSCLKTRIIFGKDDMDVWRTWETPEATIWTSKGSSTAPVRIEVLDSLGRTNTLFVFKEVDLRRPPSALFTPPKGFTKCDQESLMKRIMEKWPKDK